MLSMRSRNQSLSRILKVMVASLVFLLALVALEAGANAATTIKVWLPFPLDRDREFWTGVIKDFEKENPDIHVAPEFMEGGSQFVLKHITAAKSGDLPDVVHMGGATHVDFFITGGIVQPITKYIDPKKFVKGVLLPYRGTAKPQYKGELFEVPLGFQISLLGYNKDIFDKFGLKPARTWEEHLVLLAELKKKGVIPLMNSGRDLAGLVLWNMQELVITLSGDDDIFPKIFSRMEEDFDNRYVRQAFEIFRRESEFYGTGWETATWQDNDTLFFQGRLAITAGSAGTIKRIEEEFPGLKFGIAPPPTIEGKPREVRGRPWGFGISSTTKYKEEAIRFIQYMTTEKVQVKLVQTYLDLPATRAVYEGRLMDTLFARYPAFKMIADYQDHVFVDPLISTPKEGSQLQQKLGEMMVGVGMGKVAIDQAIKELNQLQQKFRESMKGGK